MSERMTAEGFVEWQNEDFDVGRWSELVEGSPVAFEPPDQMHGTVVLNFSKVVADFVQREPDAGCAAFDLGLVVSRDPDTVHFPAFSWFPGEGRFDRTDDVLCETPPAFVADVVSSPKRLASVGDRVRGLHDWGVETVWVLEVERGVVKTSSRTSPPETLRAGTPVERSPGGCSLRLDLEGLFAEPSWWTG